MTRFLLVRHGEAAYELAEERRLRGMGRDLVPLTPKGVRQVQRLAHTLALVDMIVSSPMTRALQTATILATHWSVPVEVEFDLHEWLPDLSCTYDSVASVEQARSEFDRNDGRWPPGTECGWEQRCDVASRSRRVLEQYRGTGGTVAVVCHGGVIEALTGERISVSHFTEYTLPPIEAGPPLGETGALTVARFAPDAAERTRSASPGAPSERLLEGDTHAGESGERESR